MAPMVLCVQNLYIKWQSAVTFWVNWRNHVSISLKITCTGIELLRVLLYRHKYVDRKLTKWSTSATRNQSLVSMTDGAEDHEPSYLQKFSRQFSRHDSEIGVGRQFSRHDSEFSHQIKNLLDDDHKQFNGTKIPDIILTEDDRLLENNQQSNNGGVGHMAIDMTRENSRDSNASFATFQSGGDLYKLSEYAKKHSIMMRVPEDTEGALTLVGALGPEYVQNIFSHSLKKTSHQRKMRQTKCLIFNL